ncbi:hypothetical protein DL93DRAFT_2090175 [Clavulina sp. PMI_390]|nr:hypothetical protein DL93DRAFT_2090175 [Clavulina sp. PMI_390]
MLVDPNLWAGLEPFKSSLLSGLQLAVPVPLPLLVLDAEHRSASRAASIQIISELADHIQRIENLIQEFTFAKRHLEICSARVQTSLAPVAALMPSLLGEIIVLSVGPNPRAENPQISSSRSVCSSWRDIVDGTSELFTRWTIDHQIGRNLEINRILRSRAKGRPLSVTIDSSIWPFAFRNTGFLTTEGSTSKWGMTRAELEATIAGCRELVIDLPRQGEAFCQWLIRQEFENITTLTIQAGPDNQVLMPLPLPPLPQLTGLHLVDAAVLVPGSSKLRSLFWAPERMRMWAMLPGVVASCTGIVHLRLRVDHLLNLNPERSGEIRLDLPLLVTLEVGAGVAQKRSSTLWCQRFAYVVESIVAPELRSLTLFNARLIFPGDGFSLWKSLGRAAPSITSLTIAETLYVNHGYTPLISLDPIYHSWTLTQIPTKGPLFPSLKELHVLTGRHSPQDIHHHIIKLLREMGKSPLFRRIVVTPEIWAKCERHCPKALERVNAKAPWLEVRPQSSSASRLKLVRWTV